MSVSAYILIDVVVELGADTQEDLTRILRHNINPIQGITNAVSCTWYVRDVSGHVGV
jgi:Mn2+/Fe2+ NRAMP family transporter